MRCCYRLGPLRERVNSFSDGYTCLQGILTWCCYALAKYKEKEQ